MKNFMPVLAALLCACAGHSASTEAPVADVESELSRELTAPTRIGRTWDVMVFLRTRANLSAITPAAAPTRFARGLLVHRALADHARAAQAGIVADLATLGVPSANVQAFSITNAIRVQNASLSTVRALAARSDVRRIVVDRAFAAALPTPSLVTAPTATRVATVGVTATGAPRVWTDYLTHGEGVVIGGQDTGVAWTHSALKSHYRGTSITPGGTVSHDYSWHDSVHAGVSSGNACGYDLRAPCDDHGHGTHTIGTIVGDDGTSTQIGMAPGAQWMACRNMDEGVGRVSQYLECFEWFLAPYPQGADPRTAGDATKAPDVINNSWGCDASGAAQGHGRGHPQARRSGGVLHDLPQRIARHRRRAIAVSLVGQLPQARHPGVEREVATLQRRDCIRTAGIGEPFARRVDRAKQILGLSRV